MSIFSSAFDMARMLASAMTGAEFADHNAAWKDMTGVCGDMIAEVSRKLAENAEWRMELLDESKRPIFRIRLVAETLQDTD
jgi:hypothetical protein